MTASVLSRRILRHMDLERGEAMLLSLMGLLVCVLLGAYTVAKVLRDTLFISAFGARALPFGYIAVAAATIVLVKAETWLSRRRSRPGFIADTQLMAIAASGAAALLLPAEQRWLALGFYIWSGSQGMLLLSHFWALALDVWDSQRARRIFPLLTGCGLLGGVAGGALAHQAAPRIGMAGLLWVLTGLLVLVRLLTTLLSRRQALRPMTSQLTGSESRIGLALRSSFLKHLAASIALSVLVTTLVDFQFKYVAQEKYPDGLALARFLGGFHAILDASALVVQFGAAGWILRHAGLGLSSGIQPASVLGLALWSALAPAWWLTVIMRGIQGLTFQTLGKSTTEIYYMAVRPSERRRVKPALDVVVERSADALIGVLLVVILRAFGVNMTLLAGLTAFLAALWIVALFRTYREYTRAFRESLAARWAEPEMEVASLGNGAARQALLNVLMTGKEPQIVAALELCRETSHWDTNAAVLGCLAHPSPKVRAAALATMEGLGLSVPAERVRGFLLEEDNGLRRAAAEYLISRGPNPVGFARSLLEGDDPVLRNEALEIILARPRLAPGAVTLKWVDRCIESGGAEALEVAARALGALRGRAVTQRLRLLLRESDLGVRRAALLAASRRSSSELLDEILPLLHVQELRLEAAEALAAPGGASLPIIEDLVLRTTDRGVQAIAAHALARTGTHRAVAILTRLARCTDEVTRYLGLRNLNRIRHNREDPVIPRSLAHRIFLRELRAYRRSVEMTLILDGRPEPELRLLADSYQESADWALERGCRALACWYEPQPFQSVYEGLRSREREGSARALEYLGQILPGKLLRSVLAQFESRGDPTAAPEAPGPQRIAACILHAWDQGDPWLRACAVRAARVTPGIDFARFESRAGDDELIAAELESLGAARAAGSRRVRRTTGC